MEKTETPDITLLVEQYAGELISWASYKVSDSELAKDLVQDTFLAASQKISTFQGKSSPKTWLFSILNFKIIDHYRAKARQPVKLKTQSLLDFFTDQGEWKDSSKPKPWQEDDGNLLDDADFQNVLKNCMAALPDKWNACIKLRYLMNKKGEEICQELNITPTNFWQIMHRAKLNLRDCIETNWYSS